MSNGIGQDTCKTEARLEAVISRICGSSERLAIAEGRLQSTNNKLLGASDAPMLANNKSPETVSKAGAIGKIEDSLDTLECKVSYIQDQVNRLCDSDIV